MDGRAEFHRNAWLALAPLEQEMPNHIRRILEADGVSIEEDGTVKPFADDVPVIEKANTKETLEPKLQACCRPNHSLMRKEGIIKEPVPDSELKNQLTHNDGENEGKVWMTRYEELKLFKQKFGHCRVPPSYKNRKLARWIHNVRCRAKHWNRNAKVSGEKLRLLEEIGFKI